MERQRSSLSAEDHRAARHWYPGDDVVDLIASDPYDWSNCRQNNTAINLQMTDLVRWFLAFSHQHPQKGLMLTEWGSSEFRDSGTKADFINQARALFKQPEWANLEAVLYFSNTDSAFPGCIWAPRSSDAAWTAFAHMAWDPFYSKGT